MSWRSITCPCQTAFLMALNPFKTLKLFQKFRQWIQLTRTTSASCYNRTILRRRAMLISRRILITRGVMAPTSKSTWVVKSAPAPSLYQTIIQHRQRILLRFLISHLSGTTQLVVLKCSFVSTHPWLMFSDGLILSHSTSAALVILSYQCALSKLESWSAMLHPIQAQALFPLLCWGMEKVSRHQHPLEKRMRSLLSSIGLKCQRKSRREESGSLTDPGLKSLSKEATNYKTTDSRCVWLSAFSSWTLNATTALMAKIRKSSRRMMTCFQMKNSALIVTIKEIVV